MGRIVIEHCEQKKYNETGCSTTKIGNQHRTQLH